MPLIYMCTLGQRPEAITLALDKLQQQYTYDKVVVLHTEPDDPGIQPAYRQLMRVLRHDYRGVDISHHELCYENGDPLIDIKYSQSAAAYHLALLHVLLEYKEAGHMIHLMVAGGRKAMSIYATLAATLVLREPDRVLTVISPPALVRQADLFHLTPQWQHLADDIHIIDLPFLESRLLPGYMRQLLHEADIKRTTTGRALWSNMSKKERVLAGLLERNPHASNKELAAMLRREVSTIENQLRSIYRKLGEYYNLNDHEHKRHRLIEVLSQREQP